VINFFFIIIISSLPHGRSSALKPSNLLCLEPFSLYVHMIPSLCRQSYQFLACPLISTLHSSLQKSIHSHHMTNPSLLPLVYKFKQASFLFNRFFLSDLKCLHTLENSKLKSSEKLEPQLIDSRMYHVLGRILLSLPRQKQKKKLRTIYACKIVH